jgi:hypothetical protein
MSSNLEGVIRPFQLPDFAPPERAQAQQYIPNRNAILSVGAQGSVKTLGGSFDLTITYYMVRMPKEEKKQGSGAVSGAVLGR